MDNIVKVMSCQRRCNGFATYRCSNEDCGHAKVVPFTCGGRFCNGCGHKSTQLWIAKQTESLPETTWQHITFTLPEVFWDLFWENRTMLNDIAHIAAEVIQSIALERGIKVGIFTALHTFGRDLKRNVHIHLSVTWGGIKLDDLTWKDLYFAKSAVMQRWRRAVLDWLDQCQQQTDFTYLPSTIDNVSDAAYFNFQLDYYKHRYWHVHLGEPKKNHLHNVNYLGRYIKRPPIAESKLRHYDGHIVTFTYLNRTDNAHQEKRMDVMTFIRKLTDHIPDRHFRNIRYYGFLANSIRGKWLPLVRELLSLPDPIDRQQASWDVMHWEAFGTDPLRCILCGSNMRLTGLTFCYSTAELCGFHQKLALRKWIPC